MIAPIKEPQRRLGGRRSSPGLARAHRWISKTLLVETPASKENANQAARRWLIVGWLAVVAAYYFGRLVAEFVELR